MCVCVWGGGGCGLATRLSVGACCVLAMTDPTPVRCRTPAHHVAPKHALACLPVSPLLPPSTYGSRLPQGSDTPGLLRVLTWVLNGGRGRNHGKGAAAVPGGGGGGGGLLSRGVVLGAGELSLRAQITWHGPISDDGLVYPAPGYMCCTQRVELQVRLCSRPHNPPRRASSKASSRASRTCIRCHGLVRDRPPFVDDDLLHGIPVKPARA